MSNIGFFKIITEEGRPAYVRADEVGTCYEGKVSVKPGPGRPPKEGVQRMIEVVTLTIRNGRTIHARNETLETIFSKIKQSLGSNLILVEKAVMDPRPLVVIREKEDAA